MTFRKMKPEDVSIVFDIRSSTYENSFSEDDLRSLGITEETVISKLSSTHCGWICELENQCVGFSIADGSNGEFWVIAVLPEFEGKGIGSQLLALAEQWLSSKAWQEVWLWTSTDKSMRAYQLYRKYGWIGRKVEGNQLYMTKQMSLRELL